MKFQFGHKKPDIKTYAIVGIVLGFIVTGISRCTGVPEEKVWDHVDEVQRTLKPGTIVNDFVIKDPEKLQRRVHRDVDRAIVEYDRIVEKHQRYYGPKYSESPNNDSECYSQGCKALSPPMRICSPFVDGCESGTEGLTN